VVSDDLLNSLTRELVTGAEIDPSTAPTASDEEDDNMDVDVVQGPKASTYGR
jgi:hypothetical protein